MPDAFAQITGLRSPVGADPDRRHIGPDRRDVVRHGGREKLRRRRRGRYHGGLVKAARPAAIAGPVDDRTIGEPIGKSGGTNTMKIVKVGEHLKS